MSVALMPLDGVLLDVVDVDVGAAVFVLLLPLATFLWRTSAIVLVCCLLRDWTGHGREVTCASWPYAWPLEFATGIRMAVPIRWECRGWGRVDHPDQRAYVDPY